MKDDSIDGIYDTLKTCAMISKTAGGIGLNIHNIRAKGSYIAGTNGYSNGIVPMLRAYDATARYVDQGGNKRPGAFAYVSFSFLISHLYSCRACLQHLSGALARRRLRLYRSAKEPR